MEVSYEKDGEFIATLETVAYHGSILDWDKSIPGFLIPFFNALKERAFDSSRRLDMAHFCLLYLDYKKNYAKEEAKLYIK